MENPEIQLQKPGWQTKFNRVGKIFTAALLTLLVLPTMGMIWAKDNRKSPEYCAFCHNEPYYSEWQDAESISLAQAHAQRSLTCQSCHDRTMAETMSEMGAYIVGYEVPLKERELTTESCLVCHESYAKMIPLTAEEITGAERNPHAGHWGELNCGVCHNVHRSSVDYCSGCHDPVTDAEGWITAAEAQKALNESQK